MQRMADRFLQAHAVSKPRYSSLFTGPEVEDE